MEANQKTHLCTRHGSLSLDRPCMFTITDYVEGDMEFVFKLTNNDSPGSFTNYNTINEHQAELIISNVSGNGISSTDIELGTYKKVYSLFASFVIFPFNGTWQIDVDFKIKSRGK